VLVLTRKAEESITIGSRIRVTVLEIRGQHVKLGIDAPKETPVNRTEVYESIIQENIKASQAPHDLNRLHQELILEKREQRQEP